MTVDVNRSRRSRKPATGDSGKEPNGFCHVKVSHLKHLETFSSSSLRIATITTSQHDSNLVSPICNNKSITTTKSFKSTSSYHEVLDALCCTATVSQPARDNISSNRSCSRPDDLVLGRCHAPEELPGHHRIRSLSSQRSSPTASPIFNPHDRGSQPPHIRPKMQMTACCMIMWRNIQMFMSHPI